MIKINIADIAKKRGLSNAYALQIALKCSPTMASRLWKGTFKQIGVETIDKLCELLRSEPSDLFSFTSARVTTEKPVRPRETVKAAASDSGETLLSTAEVAEKLGLKLSSIREHYNSGKLPFVKIKKKNFVRESDFIAFRESRK